MFERDYLIRMITQAVVAIGKLMGLKEQKKHEAALEHIDEYLSRELRMRTRLALGLSDDDLLQMLSTGGVPNLESVAILAAFLQEEGELRQAMNQPGDAVAHYEKALRLLIYVRLEGGTIEELRMEERIYQLIARLAPYELSSNTKRSIWRWHERQGQYADAENMLYELLDEQAVKSEEGRAFYARLEQLDDEALENGGLPRPELREGIEDWVRRSKESAD